MPRYLIRSSFTPEAWAELIRRPENRRDAIRPMIEEQGGKLECLYFAFGQDDAYVIAELPGNTEAAALAIRAAASGALGSIQTTLLMTAEEAQEAMRQAGKVQYSAPGRAKATAGVQAPDV